MNKLFIIGTAIFALGAASICYADAPTCTFTLLGQAQPDGTVASPANCTVDSTGKIYSCAGEAVITATANGTECSLGNGVEQLAPNDLVTKARESAECSTDKPGNSNWVNYKGNSSQWVCSYGTPK